MIDSPLRAETLFRKLQLLGGRVTGWFFTHPHSDHVGAFCRLIGEHGDEIRVDTVYRNFLPEAFLCRHEPHEADNTRKYLSWPDRLMSRHNISAVKMLAGGWLIMVSMASNGPYTKRSSPGAVCGVRPPGCGTTSALTDTIPASFTQLSSAAG
ncbi:MAG: hypothetical protein IJ343_11055 [Clostridia bacterium]|nr:hypothetical protein [Clostridia bacterium]